MSDTILIFFAMLFAAPLAAAAEDLPAGLESKDASERASAVKTLARVDGTDASKAIARALADRDAGVRAAALKALGGRRDDVSLKALRGALRRFADDPELLPVAIASIGASADAGSAKAVADIARKSVGANARTARTAIDSLGQLRSEDSVKGLMDILGAVTDPTRGAHHEFLADVLDSLREVTGLPFTRPETWKTWWKSAKRNWRATPLEPPADGTTWRQDGWRFSVARPGATRWEFSRPRGAVARIAFRGEGEEARFAFLDVMASASGEGGSKSVEAAAASLRSWMEEELRDVGESEFGARTRIAGSSAIRNTITGILETGWVVRWSTFALEHNGIFYSISVQEESGASEAVRAELTGILASFRLLDR